MEHRIHGVNPSSNGSSGNSPQLRSGDGSRQGKFRLPVRNVGKGDSCAREDGNLVLMVSSKCSCDGLRVRGTTRTERKESIESKILLHLKGTDNYRKLSDSEPSGMVSCPIQRNRDYYSALESKY